MEITSTDIAPGRRIDSRFTCEGENVSPQLSWSGVPEGARELVLICEDPDAPGGTYTHWVVANIDPAARGFERGAVPQGVVEGVNDFGRNGYGGPEPPRGHGPHRYYFRLFALRSPSGITPGTKGTGAQNAIRDKVLAEASLMGTYERA